MKCVNARQKLTLYISEALSVDQTERIEKHLEDCPGCQAFRDELMLQRELLAKLDKPPVPGVDVAAIIQKHDGLAPGRLNRRQRFAGLVVASMIVTVTLAATWEREPAEERARLTQLPASVLPEPDIAQVVNAPVAKSQPAPVEAKNDAPTVITLYTDDPDVVIHWFGD